VRNLDLSDAKRFGELVYLLPNNKQKVHAPAQATRSVRSALWANGYERGDHILCVGDPTAIAVVVAVALEIQPNWLCLLRWDNTDHIYYEIEVKS